MTDGAVHAELDRLRKRAERERQARLKAESIAEQGTLQLYERQRQSELLHVIADAANAATSVESAIQVALDQVCAYTGWPMGHAYLVVDNPTLVLVPSGLWHLDHPEQFLSFRQHTEATRFRSGEGLPGRVLERRNSVWVVDVTKDANFPRAKSASEVGLRGAFAFPIHTDRNIGAVLEFFSREAMEPDPTWLEIVGQVGTQLGRVFERKQAEHELGQIHNQLLEVSHRAGMAEVATSVLHNVGNVLNSVNVSATLVGDNLRKSKVSGLAKAVVLMQEHAADLATFFNSNPKGQQLPVFLEHLAQHLVDEQAIILKEVDLLKNNIEHIKQIVAMQQSVGKISGVIERLKVTEIVDDALRINASTLARHDVHVSCEYDSPIPEISVEKHRVLQILVNLLRNAKQSCDAADRHDKRLTIAVTHEDNCVRIIVSDNGIGIPPENLTRIFAHGFTTKQEGHGFGLHSGAIAAKQMGGSLTAHSDGPGHGAAFTLELPCQTHENVA